MIRREVFSQRSSYDILIKQLGQKKRNETYADEFIDEICNMHLENKSIHVLILL